MCLSDLFPLPLGSGGDERDRTDDPLLARQALSQLSYTPKQASDLTYHRGLEDDTGRKRDSLFFASLTLGAFAPLFSSADCSAIDLRMKLRISALLSP